LRVGVYGFGYFHLDTYVGHPELDVLVWPVGPLRLLYIGTVKSAGCEV